MEKKLIQKYPTKKDRKDISEKLKLIQATKKIKWDKTKVKEEGTVIEKVPGKVKVEELKEKKIKNLI